jgi:hypothetical protein
MISTDSSYNISNKASLLDEFESLLNLCSNSFSSYRVWQRGRDLACGLLSCMGKHTITGMLSSGGQQYLDWTSAYRMFSKGRVDTKELFSIVSKICTQEIEAESDIILSMDDTILKKTGKTIPGTSWRRDPLGPKFSTNFIWGQRFLQISMSLSESGLNSRSRGIPITFQHCPSVKKPSKKADDLERKVYVEQKKKQKLSVQGSACMHEVRARFDKNGYGNRTIHVNVDGSYSNKEVLKNMPDRTILTGRIRKDTKLYSLPDKNLSIGRKRVYGERIPTPEEIRQSDDYQWQEVDAWAAGKIHKFNVKVVKNIRWRPAGEHHTMQLVVIRPLGYRLTKSSKMLYREPAYLICTDNNLTIEKLLQAYLWRWEIEVNFREEKSILGCGEAQVRNSNSIESVPAFVVVVYGLLLLAARRVGLVDNELLPRALWYPKKTKDRTTTGDILNNYKAQLFCKATQVSFSGFVKNENKLRTLRNKSETNTSPVFFCRR